MPEWPPSPLRLFQAMVSASAGYWNERTEIIHSVFAFQWFENLDPPEIIASDAIYSDNPYRLYVPDNVADKVADIAKCRPEKDIRSSHLLNQTVHYLFNLESERCPYLEELTIAVRNITHLGWGIDMVVGDLSILSSQQASQLVGNRWKLSLQFGLPLRVPVIGTIRDIMNKHDSYLNRLKNNVFNPVTSLKVFNVCKYSHESFRQIRPYAVFELRNADGSFFHYPQKRFIHISGMIRHAAIEEMRKSPPSGVPDDWIETYVAGHAKSDGQAHQQFSYLPLLSIGHIHTNPSIRRVMITAPMGDDLFLEHLSRRLEGKVLKPTDETRITEPPTLVRVKYDKVAKFYTQPSKTWASVTPVILPGHDDHKPEKTKKLIEKALSQSGIEQECDFEWASFSCFPKSLTAHKYDNEKKPTGYIRPSYLLSQSAVHLKIQFKNGIKVPGPLNIGAGRHCGFGVFASIDK
jgi:CRISPR-associated protein Csb2